MAARKTATGNHLKAVGNVVTQADEEAFVARLEEMPEEYLECRAMRSHAWVTREKMRLVDSKVEDGFNPRMGNTKYVSRLLFCSRCTMVRRDFFTMTTRRGHTILRKLPTSSYTPPPKYALPGSGGVKRLNEYVYGLLYEQAVFAAKNAKPWTGKGGNRGA